MKKYYFTFGQGHYTRAGVLMKDYYVCTIASTYEEARTAFIDSFASIVMPTPNLWAFQYQADDFKAHFYPLGQYALILAPSTYKAFEALVDFYPEIEVSLIEVDKEGRKVLVYGQQNVYGLRWEIMDTA